MKKELITTSLAVLMLPVLTLAVSDNANQGTTTQNQNTVAVQAQVQTSNPDTGLQTQVRTESQIQLQTEQDIESTKQQYEVKGQVSGIRSSEVAKTVQGMLEVANRTNDPGVGDEIRNIAKAQNEAEDIANKAMDKVQSRREITKFFIGANYGQIKEIKNIINQNQERIRQLQQIMVKLSNEDEKTEIQNQINVLELQNLSLSDQLQEENRGFSLFGWLIRLFYGL